ncbi:organic cation transporter protein-like [Saccoglossus kowalevskii]
MVISACEYLVCVRCSAKKETSVAWNAVDETAVSSGRSALRSIGLRLGMDFDHVLRSLGEFGRYQKYLYSMLCCMLLPSCFIVLGQVFTIADVPHRCRVSEFDGGGGDDQSITLAAGDDGVYNDTYLYVPFENNDKICTPSSCYRYYINASLADLPVNLNLTASSSPCSFPRQLPITACDEGWVYYYGNDNVRSSVVTEWDLVCDRAWLREMARSSVYAGSLVGSLILSPLSDKFGRRPVIFIGLLVNVFAGIGSALSPFFQVFVAFQFVSGITFCSVFTTSYIYVQEWVGPSTRSFVGCTISLSHVLSMFVLAAISYFVLEWRALQLLISIPQSTILAYWWFVPESPRWLISQGRVKEAEVIIMKAARINKSDLCPLLPMQGSWKVELETTKKSVVDEQRYTVFDLFRTATLRKVTLNVFFQWIAACMVYYGLTLNIELLPGNPYLNFCLSGLVEIPANLFSMVLMERLGRPKALCLYFTTAGVGCIASALVPKVTLILRIVSTSLAVLGKLGATAAFYSSWVYATELFPTVLRNTGVGAAVCIARFGGFSVPFVSLLSKYWKPSVFIVYGGVSVFAGLLVLFLPETKNKHLPTTIQDVDKFVRKKRRRKKRRKIIFATDNYTDDFSHYKQNMPLKTLSNQKKAEAEFFNFDDKLLAESNL